MYVALGYEELLVFVFEHEGKQVVNLACIAVEDFALAVLDVALDIKRYGLCNTEILHVFGDIDAHLLAELEEIVDGVAAGEDYSCMVEDVYTLSTKLTWGKTLNFDKGSENDFYFVLVGNGVVGGLL